MGTNIIPVEQFYAVLQFQKETIIEFVKTISFFNFMSLTIKQNEITDHSKKIKVFKIFTKYYRPYSILQFYYLVIFYHFYIFQFLMFNFN